MPNRNFEKKVLPAFLQFSRDRDYWMKKLSGNPMASRFPPDYYQTPGNADNSTFTGMATENVKFQLGGEQFSRLMKISNHSDSRLFIILVMGLVLLLHKYTGDDDIVVGVPIDKQKREGQFINTILALRNRLSPHMTVKDLLFQVRQTTVEANENQNYPLESIIYELNPSVNPGGNFPLFDIALLINNIHEKSYISHLKLNMVFSFARRAEDLEGEVEYNPLSYKKESIRRIIDHFTHLLHKAFENADLRIIDLEILTKAEKEHLLIAINNTAVDYPAHRAIHELFERQVGKNPGNIVMEEVDTARFLTYHQLNESVHRLAAVLKERGVGRGTIAAIMGERTIEIVTGLLAILKAGAVFLPLDAQNPDERIKLMLSDSGASVFLSQKHVIEHHREVFQHFSAENIIAVDDNRRDRKKNTNLGIENTSSDLVYIIYTSGTTGKPKGVSVQHKSLVNYIHFTIRNYVKDEPVNFPLYSSIAFDLTMTSIFTPLLTGNAIVLYGGWGKGNLIERIVDDNKVDIVKLTPSHLSLIRNKKIEIGNSRIKRLIVGGEMLEYQLARDIYDNFKGNIEIFNEYGPTEATVGCMLYKFHPGDDKGKSVPIGGPADNAGIYLMDKNVKPVLIGAIGEIYISGAGLARGYLNSPELTADKFDHDLWDYQDDQDKRKKVPGKGIHMSYISKKIYKTGDLAQWLSPGNMRFLGRNDQQVKIRGFRIETGEIETQLMKHPDIKNIFITVMEEDRGGLYGGKNHDRSLCAYFVSDNSLTTSALREYLSGKLPDYMVPSNFVKVDKIPLTLNGKVDRNALPKPEIKKGTEYTPPRDETEKNLAEIWSELLGVTKGDIGIDSNFFELGGHSLSGTVLVARIHKVFNKKLSLVDIFRLPTIRELAVHLNKMARQSFTPMQVAEKKEYYALSPAQKRLYFMQHMDLDSIAYNITQLLILEGELDRQKFSSTIRMLIKRHETFRTSFLMVDENPVQEIYEEVDFEVEYYNLQVTGAKDMGRREEVPFGQINARGGQHPKSRELRVKSCISSFVRPFDMAQAPLLRVGLIVEEKEKHIFMADMHHIIADGVSQATLAKDLMALYNDEELPGIKLRYRDFSEWLTREEQRKSLENQKKYWLEKFKGEIPVLNIPIDYVRPVFQSFEGSTGNLQVGGDQSKGLKNLAIKNGTTLYVVLLAVFNVLLSKITGQEDIVIGTITAGRQHGDLEHLIGMFVNTLAIRNYPKSEKTFSQFLREVQESTFNAFENQDYPFEDIVETLGVKRDTNSNPIFNVLFEFNDLETPELKIPGMKLKPYQYQKRTSKFDLTLKGWERTETLSFNLEYSTNLYKRETIEVLFKYFNEIISIITAAPNKKLQEIIPIPQERKKEILEQMNRELEKEMVQMKASSQILQHRFIDSMGKSKNKIALEYGPFSLTYRELDKRSNQVANQILKKGITTGTFIGILLEDGMDLICTIIGILKAGCVFVPLDSAYPETRLENMIHSTGIKFIVGDKHNINSYAANAHFRQEYGDGEFILIDKWFTSEKSPGLVHPPNIQYKPEDKIYIYFTSGSTGKPKAILGKNNSLMHFIHWEISTFAVDDTFYVSQLITPGFDAFLRDVFVPLCAGGKICIPFNQNMKTNSGELIDWVERSRVNLIHCVPTLFRLLKPALLTPENFKSLKFVLFSGEKINASDLIEWYDILNERITFVNLYGPTETTLIKTYHFIRPDDLRKARIPIGRPMRGTGLMILDNNMNLCDQLVTGEIYIRTLHGTYGYYQDPASNRKNFIRNPFTDVLDDIIYKTGDMGRVMADGNIDLLGRNDRQVKIRGIRIELEEIENVLLSHAMVKEAVVIKKEMLVNDEGLWAYITVKEKFAPSGESIIDTIREYLSEKLPLYMIPANITTVEEIPRKPNGKVDYEALAALDIAALEYIPPTGDTEGKLVELWSDILKIGKIGIMDNFFQLGGNSFNVMTLVSLIHRTFDIRLSLKDFFANLTIKKQAKLLEKYLEEIPGMATITRRKIINGKRDKYISLESAEKKEYYPSSLTQKRFYILQQLNPGSTGYNFSSVFIIEDHLEKKKLEETFKKLIKKHESLRTSFDLIDGEPVQKVHNGAEVTIECYKSPEEKAKRIIRDFVKPFDLEYAPLIRWGLITVEDARHILMVDMHHIITDGLSYVVLLKEFTELYRGKTLFPLRLQYTDFSEWQNKKSEKERINQQGEFWLKQFEGVQPALKLRTDYPRPPIQSFKGTRIDFEIGVEETAVLRNLVLQEDTSIFMILFAMYNVLLWKLSGQVDIIVGTGVANRGHADINNIIGLFFNTIPLRNPIKEEKSFREFLKDLKERTLEAFENQDYPIDMLVQDLLERGLLKRDPGRNPLFDTMFAMQNFWERTESVTEVELPGIKIKPFALERRTSRFDLFLMGTERPDIIHMELEYSTALFKPPTARKIAGYYLEILKQVLANEDIKMKDITISSDFDKIKSNTDQTEYMNFGF